MERAGFKEQPPLKGVNLVQFYTNFTAESTGTHKNVCTPVEKRETSLLSGRGKKRLPSTYFFSTCLPYTKSDG